MSCMAPLQDASRGSDVETCYQEIQWNAIPLDKRPLFQDAEVKQWAELLPLQALTPLDVETSPDILRPRAPGCFSADLHIQRLHSSSFLGLSY